jgi:uncharacterized protein involved in exopolysaccharide biosynthesis
LGDQADEDTRETVVRPAFASADAPRRGGRPGRQWTYWDAIRTFSLRNFIFAVLLGVFCAAAGGVIALSRPDVYSSKASMLIDQPKALVNATDEGPIRKLAVLRFKYTGLAATPAITTLASQSTGIGQSTIATSVIATAAPDSLILAVTSQSPSAALAPRIANGVAQAIVSYADNEQGVQGVAPGDRYRFLLVQPAVGAVKTQPTKSSALQSAAALGILGLGAAYVLLQLGTADVRLR